MTDNVTFDPPLLPIDDYARSGATILRYIVFPGPYGNTEVHQMESMFDMKAESDAVWFDSDEGGWYREDQLHPGYWPLPNIKVEKK